MVIVFYKDPPLPSAEFRVNMNLFNKSGKRKPYLYTILDNAKATQVVLKNKRKHQNLKILNFRSLRIFKGTQSMVNLLTCRHANSFSTSRFYVPKYKPNVLVPDIFYIFCIL